MSALDLNLEWEVHGGPQWCFPHGPFRVSVGREGWVVGLRLGETWGLALGRKVGLLT